jgi:hypothetical protein
LILDSGFASGGPITIARLINTLDQWLHQLFPVLEFLVSLRKVIRCPPDIGFQSLGMGVKVTKKDLE